MVSDSILNIFILCFVNRFSVSSNYCPSALLQSFHTASSVDEKGEEMGKLPKAGNGDCNAEILLSMFLFYVLLTINTCPFSYTACYLSGCDRGHEIHGHADLAVLSRWGG